MNSYKNPPEFNSQTKPYDRYIEELKGWCIVTELDKKKRGIAIALSMPENDPSGVRDKIFNEISLEQLNTDGGVDILINYMNSLFKRDELSDIYERYLNFDRFSREAKQKMEEFILEFEKRYNRIKQKEMALPTCVLAFKLLDASGLSHRDRQLVLTGVDYSNKNSMYDQMKASLKKFHGEQAIPETKSKEHLPIKHESPEEPVFYTSQRPFNHRRGRGGFQGNRNRGYYGNNNQRKDKPTNPIGFNGKPIKCKVCESIMHLMKDCPYSNSHMPYPTYEADSSEPVVLFTGGTKNDMCLLTYESRNSAVLDSGCSSTVAGKKWINCYIDSLSEPDKMKITRSPGSKNFKFGGGETKQSIEEVEIPGHMAGVPVMIKTDVVDSEIPLLLSKTAMKNAKIKLDLENDKALIFGKEINLDSTTCGHYCIPLNGSAISTSDCLLADIQKSDIKKKELQLVTIHKQFAHPSFDKMKALLQDASFWDDDCNMIMKKIYDNCNTCLKFKKTPMRPAVSLPLATKFNEAVAMDLKYWKNGLYIFYLIDMFSRFTKADWIKSKDPEIIIDKIFSMWIGDGLGNPQKFLADNGGEFANDKYRSLGENLNIHVINTAGESPWQNGLCERNHAVVDRCLEKILEDHPHMSLKTALAWAINAKNSLHMNSGFSSYQIVFGQQPTLPSTMIDKPPALSGTTTSRNVAKHINAMHLTRQAFIEAESAERVRRALRNKLRSHSNYFTNGDKVYYKREDSVKWKGPGVVIGQDGKVILVRHGSTYVRVSANRILKAGEEFSSSSEPRHCDSSSSASLKEQPIPPSSDSEDDCVNKSNSIRNFQTSADTAIDNSSAASESRANNNITERNSQINFSDVNQQDSVSLNENSKYIFPKIHDKILYKETDMDTWNEGEVIGRAGKSTGKYSSWINIKTQEGAKSVDLDRIAEWKLKTSSNLTEEVNVVMIPRSRHHEKDVVTAKKIELKNWHDFNVYTEVQNQGQKTISTTWVITEKVKNNQKVVKARLVARGFEEDLAINVDSPTASKSTMRVFFAIVGMKQWECKTIDIKAAFLQGHKITRDVYLKPPLEERQDGIIWKLNKVVYGLNDAARNWYLSIVEKLICLGCKQSNFDKAIFHYSHQSQLCGIFQIHVDDFIHAGNELFQTNVIKQIETTFKISKTEEQNFKYIGLNITHQSGAITVNQNTFIDDLEAIPINPKRSTQKFDSLNKVEAQQYRTAVGQINWIASTTRPDVMYDLLELSMSMKEPKILNLVHANKVIKRIKLESYSLIYPQLGPTDDLYLAVFTDASLANLPDQISSAGGYVILLIGSNEMCCVLSWSSCKIKRVVKSTSAAEALTLLEGVEEAVCLQALLSEILSDSLLKVPIKAYIDSKNIHSAIHSTKTVSEKRLRLDIAALKQMLHRKDTEEVSWIESSKQLADCLSKKGASSSKLVNILKTGCIDGIIT